MKLRDILRQLRERPEHEAAALLLLVAGHYHQDGWRWGREQDGRPALPRLDDEIPCWAREVLR